MTTHKVFHVYDPGEELVAVLSNGFGARSAIISAIHNEGEGTFEMEYLKTDPKAEYLASGYYIGFYDMDAAYQLFEIVTAETLIAELPIVHIYAEHVSYELLGDVIGDIRPSNTAVGLAIAQALNGTRWTVGSTVDAGLNSSSAYYINVREAVKKFAEVWGVEVEFALTVSRNVITERKVNIVRTIGEDRGMRFEYTRNTQSISGKLSIESLYTALIGRGRGEQVGETDAGDATYGRRIDFADVVWSKAAGDPTDKPAGQVFVEDLEAKAQWGRANGTRNRVGIVTFDQVTEPDELLQKTWEQLQEVKKPIASYELTVLDLEGVRGRIDAVRRGDIVSVIHKAVNPPIYLKSRVVDVRRNLLVPENTELSLGDTLATGSSNMASAAKVAEKTQSINPNGTITTDHLLGHINALVNQLTASGSYQNAEVREGEGLMFENTNPASAGYGALYLGPGIFAIANKKTGDNWDWRTFGTGSGFTADEMTTGTLRANLIKILGTDRFYWDSSNIFIIDTNNANRQIRIGLYDGVNYGIGYTQDNGATWQSAIGFDGINLSVLKIGGTNLIRNGGFAQGLDNWVIGGNLTGKQLTVMPAGSTDWIPKEAPALQITGSNDPQGLCGILQDVVLSPNTEYTLSGYWAAHRINHFHTYIRSSDGTFDALSRVDTPGIGGNTLSAYTRFEFVFTTNGYTDYTVAILPYQFGDNGFAWLSQVMLEKGNKATDWSPSPNDAVQRVLAGVVSITPEGGLRVTQHLNGSPIGTYFETNGSRFGLYHTADGSPGMEAAIDSDGKMYVSASRLKDASRSGADFYAGLSSWVLGQFSGGSIDFHMANELMGYIRASIGGFPRSGRVQIGAAGEAGTVSIHGDNMASLSGKNARIDVGGALGADDIDTAGHLVPYYTGAYDLGNATYYWRNLFVRQLMGQTKFSSDGLFAPQSGGAYFDQYGNVRKQSNDANGYWCVMDYAGNPLLRVEWGGIMRLINALTVDEGGTGARAPNAGIRNLGLKCITLYTKSTKSHTAGYYYQEEWTLEHNGDDALYTPVISGGVIWGVSIGAEGFYQISLSLHWEQSGSEARGMALPVITNNPESLGSYGPDFPTLGVYGNVGSIYQYNGAGSATNTTASISYCAYIPAGYYVIPYGYVSGNTKRLKEGRFSLVRLGGA